MSTVREVHADGWCVRLDLSRQVLRLEVPEDDAARLPLTPVPELSAGGPMSAAALLLKAKQFDDGLYAAIELAAQRGLGCFVGKATLLRSLAGTLAAGAAAVIHTACQLGGQPVAVPESLREVVRATKERFLADELQSKPLGFYTWTPELSAIFRQDRFLQRPLDAGPADDLSNALRDTAGARDAYEACLRLNARLTGPPKEPGLRDVGQRPPFFPPSRSHEVSLFERLFEGRPIPPWFDLIRELIRHVRTGDLSLEPAADAGWYARQTWSLEPLIVPERMPERGRLELGKRYRKHLEDLFRGALALARETHVRQAGGGYGGSRGPSQRPIRVSPGLTVEPLPSVYARRAACYRFVRMALEEAFGPDAISELHRLVPEGVSSTNLAEELSWIEGLFAGAAVTANSELGIEQPEGEMKADRCFSAWREDLGSDQDVSRDARMMVPVFYDEGRKRIKVWAFLGWQTTKVDTAYRVLPTVVAVNPLRAAGQPATNAPPVLFCGDRYEFAVPVMVEVYVTRLLDRDEFRRHCDRYRSRDAILAHLV